VGVTVKRLIRRKVLAEMLLLHCFLIALPFQVHVFMCCVGRLFANDVELSGAALDKV